MRSIARAKLGYYPLPEEEGVRLRTLLSFPAEGASVLDPCAGTGAALNHLTENATVTRYGVEIDADRAQQAAAAGVETIHGNIFDTQGKAECLSLLYLNPPYDSEIGAFDNKRMEFLFLEHTQRWLVPGGVLLMVIQHKQIQSCVQLLAAHFNAFRVFRLTDPEAERFDQVALFGVRKRISSAAFEANRHALLNAVWRNPLPTLTGQKPCYAVPFTPAAQLTYRACRWISLKTWQLLPLRGRRCCHSCCPRRKRRWAGPLSHCMEAMLDCFRQRDCSMEYSGKAMTATLHGGAQ